MIDSSIHNVIASLAALERAPGSQGAASLAAAFVEELDQPARAVASR